MIDKVTHNKPDKKSSQKLVDFSVVIYMDAVEHGDASRFNFVNVKFFEHKYTRLLCSSSFFLYHGVN